MKLSGKRILLFSPTFFDYSQVLTKGFEDMGATVDYYDERPSNSFWAKALVRVKPSLIRTYTNKYYDRVIERTQNIVYDLVIFINAEAVSYSSLEKLKQIHSKSTFVFYIWDSLRNKGFDLNKLSFFDIRQSFDKNDCEEYKLDFNPLFFSPKYENVALAAPQKENNKVFFVGTVHSDRYRFLLKIKNIASKFDIGTFYYLFFPSKILYYKMKFTDKFFRNTKLSDFKYVPIEPSLMFEKFSESSMVIDIQHPKQTGLTMRTIEVLGAKKKLITTNEAIKGYDFYNENNILVVDRKNPVIPDNFFNLPYCEISPEIYYSYSLRGWIEKLLF